METAAKRYVAANWKMNGLGAHLNELRLLAEMLKGVQLTCSVLVFPPFTILSQVAKLLKSADIKVGGQNCYIGEKGAFTGEISAAMLKDVGASSVILGHSERRTLFFEDGPLIREKAEAAHACGINVVLCVGETEQVRDAGDTLSVVCDQISEALPKTATPLNTIIAYEPVWAIGTGKTPSPEDVSTVHQAIKDHLHEFKKESGSVAYSVIYGGSVNEKNAPSFLMAPYVDGALVGGASLHAASFLGILRPYIGG